MNEQYERVESVRNFLDEPWVFYLLKESREGSEIHYIDSCGYSNKITTKDKSKFSGSYIAKISQEHSDIQKCLEEFKDDFQESRYWKLASEVVKLRKGLK